MSRGPRTATVRSGLMLAVAIIGAWIAIHVGAIFFWRWSPSTLLLVPIVVAVQAWLSTGLFIIAHDCMHGSLAPGRPRLNRIVGTLCLGIYAGLSYGALLPKHHAHHAAPGTGDDPDFHAAAPRRALPWFASFVRNYYTHGQIARITVAAIVYLLLGATLLNIVVFWAVPALLALSQLFFFGTYLPHRHDDQPFADAHNARSSTLPPLLSLVTCFHFGAYHHEHHLSPGTPWWRLPAVRRESLARQ
ncbi:beta-carotene ketolase (CrtW type) [Sphingomonas guangdongensis]|uniref:Beta-carotene ketolase (CrtW type) n=1 Tax=Sphingomonas guangdongensis TaxID=1141890 RepID=A0A285R7I2_9SPHN|nr:fatty acid desaturase [Sphingomonas guangdongensis]SOB88317.1 beta-carotene ketolase (CrtW type) [Sphingomonas guangdongensis]